MHYPVRRLVTATRRLFEQWKIPLCEHLPLKPLPIRQLKVESVGDFILLLRSRLYDTEMCPLVAREDNLSFRKKSNDEESLTHFIHFERLRVLRPFSR